MTREHAINYLRSSGFTAEQIKYVADALSTQPELKWNRLMLFLADLQLAYSPEWGANGCGDKKLYDFVTGLIEELEGWTDETA